MARKKIELGVDIDIKSAIDNLAKGEKALDSFNRKIDDTGKSTKKLQEELKKALIDVYEHEEDEYMNNLEGIISKLNLKDKKAIDELNRIKENAESLSYETKKEIRDDVDNFFKNFKIDSQASSTVFKNIQKDIINTKRNVDDLATSIENMFRLARDAGTEYKISIGNKNTMIKGSKNQIGQEEIITDYLENIQDGIVLNAHSHRGVSSGYSYTDVKDAIESQFNGLSNISAVFGGSDITSLNFSGVSIEIAEKILKEVQSYLSGSVGKLSGAIGASELNNIAEKFQVGPIAKAWDVSNGLPGFVEFAEYIDKIRSNAENALTPVERFKNLLTYLKPNIDLSKYSDEFERLTDNIESAQNVFNDISKKEQFGTVIDQLGNHSPLDAWNDYNNYLEARRDELYNTQISLEEILDMINKVRDSGMSHEVVKDVFGNIFNVDEMKNIDKIFDQMTDVFDISRAIADMMGKREDIESEWEEKLLLPANENMSLTELEELLDKRKYLTEKMFAIFGPIDSNKALENENNAIKERIDLLRQEQESQYKGKNSTGNTQSEGQPIDNKSEISNGLQKEKEAVESLNNTYSTEHVQAVQAAIDIEEEKRNKSKELTDQLDAEFQKLRELNEEWQKHPSGDNGSGNNNQNNNNNNDNAPSIWKKSRDFTKLEGLNFPSIVLGEDGREAVNAIGEFKNELLDVFNNPDSMSIVDMVVGDTGELEAVRVKVKYINDELKTTLSQTYNISKNDNGNLTARQTSSKSDITNIDVERQNELNELYRERADHISRIVDLDKKASDINLASEKSQIDAALSAEKLRLQLIDEEINKYGTLVDLQKLSTQNDKLTSSLRNNSVDNYLKEQAANIKRNNEEQKKTYNSLNKYLDNYKSSMASAFNAENGSAKEEYFIEQAITYEAKYREEIEKSNLPLRERVKLAEKLDSINNELVKKEQALNTDKANKEQKKAEKEQANLNFNKIENAWKRYYSAEADVRKYKSDLSGKNYEQQIGTASDKQIEAKKELEALGISIEEIEKNSLLTAKQKNRLLQDRAAILEKADKSESKNKDDLAKYQKKIADAKELKNTLYNYIRAKNKLAEDNGETIPPEILQLFDTLQKNINGSVESVDGLLSDTTTSGFELKPKLDKALDELKGFVSEAQRVLNDDSVFNKNKSTIIGNYDPNIFFDKDKTFDKKTLLSNFAKNYANGNDDVFKVFSTMNFNDDNGSLQFAAKTTKGLELFTIAANDADGSIRLLSSDGEKAAAEFLKLGQNVDPAQKAFNSFASASKQLISGLIGGAGLHRIGTEIRNGVQYVKQLDTAMTELKKVTDETDYSYSQFLHSAAETSSKIGTTITDFTNATADFARLGYSINDSAKLAESATIYKNIGDGITDVGSATESIISTMKAFNVEADDSIDIVNKFNEVGNNFAISSKGVGDALLNSASALYSAGNTIDESIALITAANSVVQNPQSVGTALKTLSLRLRGAKVQLEEDGLEVDGMADSVSTLREKLLALSGQKVDIMIDNNTFKNSTQILREMAAAWDDMSDINRAAALELMGGKRQANILSAIINNFDMVEDVINKSVNSENSAYKENEKYLDSIQGKIDKFNNARQIMWADFIDSDLIKNTVDAGTTLLNIADAMGPALSTILGLITVMGAKGTANGVFEWFGQFFDPEKKGQEESIGKIFSSKISSLKEVLKSVNNGLDLFRTDGTGFGIGNFGLGVGGGIAAGILATTAVIATIKQYYDATREAVQATTTNAKEVESSNQTLAEQRDKIIELRTALDNNTLSEEDAYNAKSELLSIQDSLIEKYGLEAQGLSLVTGELNNQVQAVNALAAANARKALSDAKEGTGFLGLGKSAYDAAFDMANNKHSVRSNFISNFSNLLLQSVQGANGVEWNVFHSLENDFSDFIKSIGGYHTTNGNEEDKISFNFDNLTYPEIETKLNSIIAWLQNNSNEYGANFSEVITAIQNQRESILGDKYSEYMDAYDELLKQQALANYSGYDEAGNYHADRDYYSKILDAQSKAEEAYKSGNNELFVSAVNIFSDAVNQAVEYANSIGDTPMAQFFDKLDNEYIALANNFQFDKTQIEPNSSVMKNLKLANESNIKQLTNLQGKVLSNEISNLNSELRTIQEDRYNEVNKANKKSLDLTKTKFGNIDTNNRFVLEWSDKNLEKNKKALQSLFKDEASNWDQFKSDWYNSYSTVLGSVGAYGKDGELEIAFSPMLQTSYGAELLTQESIDDYINTLIEKATAEGLPLTKKTLLRLDTTGITKDGKTIKKIIADVGDTAKETSETMHFTGKDGALASYDSIIGQIESDIKALETELNSGRIEPITDTEWLNLKEYIKKSFDWNKYVEGTSPNTDVWKESATKISAPIKLAFESMMALANEYNIEVDTVISKLVSMGEIQGEVFNQKPSFNMDDYATSLESLNSEISYLQSVKSKLESGEFKNGDFLELLQKTPKLAKGVNNLSGNFEGLIENVNKALSEAPVNLLKSLQDLRKQLKETGQSTESIDQLIASVSKMPTDGLVAETKQYGLLADAISQANQARGEAETISKEPDYDDNYNYRIERIKEFQKLIKKGEIGSKQYNADVKYLTGQETMTKEEATNWLSKNSKYYTEGDKGLSRWLSDVSKILSANDELTSSITNLGGGNFDIDLNPDEFDEIAKAAGMTTEAFIDMLNKYRMFSPDFRWTNGKDAEKALDKAMLDPSSTTDKVAELDKTMMMLFNTTMDGASELTGEDLLNLGYTEEEVGSLMLKIDALIKQYNRYKAELEGDPLELLPHVSSGNENINHDLVGALSENGYNVETSSDNLNKILTPAEIVNIQKQISEAKERLGKDKLDANDLLGIDGLDDARKRYEGAFGELDNGIEDFAQLCENTEFEFDLKDVLSLLTEKGYTPENIAKILQGIDFSNSIDLDIDYSNIEQVEELLDSIGVKYKEITNPNNGGVTIAVDRSQLDLVSELLGETELSYDNFRKKLEGEGATFGFAIAPSVGEAQDAADDLGADITTTFGIVETPESLDKRNKIADWVQSNTGNKKLSISVSYSGLLGGLLGGGIVGLNGTAHAQGTAYKSGTWGAEQSSRALTGELGPEIRVRGNRWNILGEHGAEFADIKKGDIIFNHKQTESLLKNGYINSRGKAYAHGTTATSGFAYNTTGSASLGNSYTSSGKKSNSSSSSKSKDDKDTKSIDFIEYKIEQIESTINKISTKIENFLDDTTQTIQKNNQYDALVNSQKEMAKTYESALKVYNDKAADLLKEIPSEFRELAKNGGIQVSDFISDGQKKTADAIEKYREWAKKADEAEINLLESIEKQAEYRVEQLKDIADDFENLTEMLSTRSSILEAEMDLIESSGQRLSDTYYKEYIRLATEKFKELSKERTELQSILDKSVQLGDVEVGSDKWFEMVSEILSVDEAIVECNSDIEEWNNAINDLKWDNFDKFITAIDDVDSQLSHLFNSLSKEEKITDETGKWTDSGIAALGLLTQQMELAQYKSEQYATAIELLKKDYADGLYSVDEYNNKLSELTENQWSSIEAYDNAQEAIVNLNKTRINAVNDGIQKELNAYRELIDAKKKSLDEDKEARDFEKDITEKRKSVLTIQKQLASLSNDNSLNAAAQRRKLQAELKKAQDELDDTYYNHSVDSQKEALDKEYEDYEKTKQDELDALEEWSKNTNQVVLDSINLVKDNTTLVLSEINKTADTYGIKISEAISAPWKDGQHAITEYSSVFNKLVDSFTGKLNDIKAEQDTIIGNANSMSSNLVDKTNNNYNTTISAQKQNTPSSTPPSSSSTSSALVSGISSNIKYGQKGDNVKVLQTALNQLGFNCGPVDGVFGSQTLAAVKSFQKSSKYGGAIIVDGLVGSQTKKKFKTAGYAKGTKGTKKDEWATVDEFGEELVLEAGKDGRLKYLTKGSSVIPSDLTDKLINLAIDPTETLRNSMPKLGAPYIISNNIEVNLDFGSLVHVDSVSNDTLPELQKMVRTEFDGMMKKLNNKLFGKVR